MNKYIFQIETYSKENKKLKDEKANLEKGSSNLEGEKLKYIEEIENLKAGIFAWKYNS